MDEKLWILAIWLEAFFSNDDADFWNQWVSLSHRKLVSTNKPVAFRSVHTGI